MSVFFAIVTAIFYGLCHLLAATAQPNGRYSFRHEILFTGTRGALQAAIADWVASDPRLQIYQQGTDKIIVNHRQSFWSFGTFIDFVINDGDGALIVAIATQPKLISTGQERTVIMESIGRRLENTTAKKAS